MGGGLDFRIRYDLVHARGTAAAKIDRKQTWYGLEFRMPERVALQPSALSIRREILGIGWSREFDLAHIRRLRVDTAPRPPRSKQVTPNGRVAFDYIGQTYRFGQAVDAAEAMMIVDELRAHHSFSRHACRCNGP